MSVLDLQGMPETRKNKKDDDHKHGSFLISFLIAVLGGCRD
jgi:hypothetical protein